VTEFLSTAPYRGTRDFLPPEMSIRQQVFSLLYETVERFGFVRYDGPLLEAAEIYEAKSGEEIANQQLYTLTDRGERRLALRPEMTPSAARIVAGHLKELRLPVRWYSHPSCYRYERPQRGRVREHWQLNVDIFGSDRMECEIEIFEVIHAIMCAVGATPDMYVLRANDRVLTDGMLEHIVRVPADCAQAVATVIDRWEKRTPQQRQEEAHAAGLDDRAFEALAEALLAGDALLDELPEDVKQRSRLWPILQCDARELVTFDPLIVRGFEYYTSTVFEVFDRDPLNRRSLFGGGRYDNLVELFSRQQVPGIGFGMGDVTLVDFLQTHDLLPSARSEVDIVVIALDDHLQPVIRRLAAELRDAGHRTSIPLAARRLGKHLAHADDAGARVAVIVGADEHEQGTVVVRDLAAHEQRIVPTDALVDAANEILNQHPVRGTPAR